MKTFQTWKQERFKVENADTESLTILHSDTYRELKIKNLNIQNV